MSACLVVSCYYPPALLMDASMEFVTGEPYYYDRLSLLLFFSESADLNAVVPHVAGTTVAACCLQCRLLGFRVACSVAARARKYLVFLLAVQMPVQHVCSSSAHMCCLRTVAAGHWLIDWLRLSKLHMFRMQAGCLRLQIAAHGGGGGHWPIGKCLGFLPFSRIYICVCKHDNIDKTINLQWLVSSLCWTVRPEESLTVRYWASGKEL